MHMILLTWGTARRCEAARARWWRSLLGIINTCDRAAGGRRRRRGGALVFALGASQTRAGLARPLRGERWSLRSTAGSASGACAHTIDRVGPKGGITAHGPRPSDGARRLSCRPPRAGSRQGPLASERRRGSGGASHCLVRGPSEPWSRCELSPAALAARHGQGADAPGDEQQRHEPEHRAHRDHGRAGLLARGRGLAARDARHLVGWLARRRQAGRRGVAAGRRRAARGRGWLRRLGARRRRRRGLWQRGWIRRPWAGRGRRRGLWARR